MKTALIYSSGNFDGIVSAWVASRYVEGEITLLKTWYKQSPRPIDGFSHVIFLDYTPTPEELNAVSKESKVMIIDHNFSRVDFVKDVPVVKTYDEFLVSQNRISKLIDVDSCGCLLTARFFELPWLPDIVKYVSDREKWEFKYPETKPYTAALGNAGCRTIEDIEKFIERPMQRILYEGGILRTAFEKEVAKIVNSKFRTVNVPSPNGTEIYTVPIVNVMPMYKSEVLNALAQNYPFAISYYDSADGRMYDYRSRKGGVNVAEIAAHFGGGGHVNAAGVFVKFDGTESLGLHG